jgi:hypothetical protein
VPEKTTQTPPREVFSPGQVKSAIRGFLEFGEQQYGKSQQGYYSGGGWAARCLRYHLEELSKPAPQLELVQVEELAATVRGDAGFGSSGS